MKKILMIILMLCMIGLPACAVHKERTLSGVAFTRGHGSAWGNQFYIEVTSQRIVALQYVDEDSGQLQSLQDIPISQQQWEEMEKTVLGLSLEEKRPPGNRSLRCRTVLGNSPGAVAAHPRRRPFYRRTTGEDRLRFSA